MISLERIIRNPATIFTAALAAASALLQIPFIDALFGVLWSQLSVVFTATSVLGFTVLPNVDLGPLSIVSGPVQGIAVVLALAYAGKLLYQTYYQFDKELDQ